MPPHMKDQLKRILKLVRRTGDTMVVTDPNGEDVYVVMNLDQYENLLDASETGSTDETFSSKEEEFYWTEPETPSIPQISTDSTPDIWNTMKPAGEDGDTWDMTTMSEQELANLELQYKEFAAKSVSEAILDTNQPLADLEAEEANTPETKANDEDFGEEQFYLEPID